jgi:transposase
MPPVDRNQPKRAKSSESRYSLMEFMRTYPDDRACLDYLWRQRYAADGHTADCAKCGVPRRHSRVESRPSYSCNHCGHHLHPTAGTIFEKSSTSLHLWFYAMYLMTSTRCGISAKQLERELGVTYKTAWRMANLIRNQLMDQDADTEPHGLSGEVEADETWVGGRSRAYERALHSRGKTSPEAQRYKVVDKQRPVYAMVQRGGNVRAWHVRSATSARAPSRRSCTSTSCRSRRSARTSPRCTTTCTTAGADRATRTSGSRTRRRSM